MLYGIEIDDSGNTTPLISDRQKAMQKARRLAIKKDRSEDEDSCTTYLLTFADWRAEGEPNNAENAIGQMVYVASTTFGRDNAWIDWKDGITEEDEL
ncbi:MAG: hypothetical protein EBT13_00395 [Rhodobacteraceae bacterium]|nr:hypothetical protein [Paracoccaceae bacterium]